jgi:hypothetical protein
MDASALAAWVQAVGSIVAIGAGFRYVVLQNRHADRAQEADRKAHEADRIRRAEVVAYGLSGWIVEIGIRIDRALATCQERLSEEPEGRGPLVAEVILEIVLGMEVDIDASLPDLHFLNSGSGDIAQLNYFAKFYDAWLERLYQEARRPGEASARIGGDEWREFYGYAVRQLTNLKTLHANAQRHISALVAQAIEKGR